MVCIGFGVRCWVGFTTATGFLGTGSADAACPPAHRHRHVFADGRAETQTQEESRHELPTYIMRARGCDVRVVCARVRVGPRGSVRVCASTRYRLDEQLCWARPWLVACLPPRRPFASCCCACFQEQSRGACGAHERTCDTHAHLRRASGATILAWKPQGSLAPSFACGAGGEGLRCWPLLLSAGCAAELSVPASAAARDAELRDARRSSGFELGAVFALLLARMASRQSGRAQCASAGARHARARGRCGIAGPDPLVPPSDLRRSKGAFPPPPAAPAATFAPALSPAPEASAFALAARDTSALALVAPARDMSCCGGPAPCAAGTAHHSAAGCRARSLAHKKPR